MENQTGFLSKEVNLDDMKEVSVKVILLGDGMSGKTQILLTFGKIILKHLNNIYIQSKDLKSDDSNKNTTIFRKTDILSYNFLNWVNSYNFLIEYGDSMWDLSTISLQTETIGIEDFKFRFPYFWNDQTWKITLKGSDLGGQNIFDHLRAVLGKIALPNDNMAVVFDKSRSLSCLNSLDHVKDVTSERNGRDEGVVRFWFIGNKSDLEEHFKKQNWREKVINTLLDCVSKEKKFTIPSLLDKGEEITVFYKIKDNCITFPDLEATIYNAIRTSDDMYRTPLLSDINTKALAREIAVQLVYYQKMKENENSFDIEPWWQNFKSLIFLQRPLALQYLRGFSAFQKQETYIGSYERVRTNWIGYEAKFPIKYEEIESAIIKAGEGNKILEEMPYYYSTNAIMGTGVLELFDSMISQALSTNQDSKLLTKKRSRRGINKF